MIEINNLTTNQINESFLKKVAKAVLGGEESKLSSSPFVKTRELKEDKSSFRPFVRTREAEKKGKTELSIALVGQGKIRELNKKYRGKNQATDVLAFSEKEIGLGEIVICLREVKKNAKRFGSKFEKELAQVLIHGILHLLGYNHKKSEVEAKEMEKKEKYYLNLVK